MNKSHALSHSLQSAIGEAAILRLMNIGTHPRIAVLPAAGAWLAAGIVIALVAMMATYAMGMGLFAAPAMIAGIVLGPQAAMSPQPLVIMSGLILHMALSMVFGVAFALLVARVSAPIVALGLAFGVALWLVNFYVLSFVSAGARAMAAHEPVWLAVLTHVIFGFVLSAIVARATAAHAGT